MVLRLSFPPNPPPIRFTRHTTRLAGTPSALATRAWGKHSTLFRIRALQSTIYHIINNPIIFFATNELTILNERNHQYFVTLLSPFLCLVQFKLCFDWECGYKLISCTSPLQGVISFVYLSLGGRLRGHKHLHFSILSTRDSKRAVSLQIKMFLPSNVHLTCRITYLVSAHEMKEEQVWTRII